MREASQRRPGKRYISMSPAAWKVPIIGWVLSTSAVCVGPGASGSWRWMTSNSSSHRARIVLSAHDTSGASGATEPLTAVGMLWPRGVIPASGGTPSQGASTRTRWPRRRSARARPSTWDWTPPGIVRLYGQTIPMRTGLTLLVPTTPPREPSAATGASLCGGAGGFRARKKTAPSELTSASSVNPGV